MCACVCLVYIKCYINVNNHKDKNLKYGMGQIKKDCAWLVE